MAEYEIIFYEAADGECPAEDFLGELSPKVRGKVAKWLDLLEREGPDLPRPYADMIRGKIRELRVSFGGLHHRFLKGRSHGPSDTWRIFVKDWNEKGRSIYERRTAVQGLLERAA